MDRDTYEQYQMQDAMNQKSLDAQQSMYAPQTFEQVQQNQAILVEQTDPKTIVNGLMLVLRGLEEQQDGSFRQVSEPKMNDTGLKAIWYILKSHINQNVILSNYDDREIRNFMDIVQNDLVDLLSLNWKLFGIKSKSDLDDIIIVYLQILRLHIIVQKSLYFIHVLLISAFQPGVSILSLTYVVQQELINYKTCVLETRFANQGCDLPRKLAYRMNGIVLQNTRFRENLNRLHFL